MNGELKTIYTDKRFTDYYGAKPLGDFVIFTKYDKPEIDIYSLLDNSWNTMKFGDRVDYSRMDLSLPRVETMMEWNDGMLCFSYLSRDFIFIDRYLNILFEEKIYFDFENIDIFNNEDLFDIPIIHEGRPSYMDLSVFLKKIGKRS